MTRLESGGVVLNREWQPLHEAVGAALHHMDRRLGERAVAIDMGADLPLVFIDGVGIQQVLLNLLDNALQHTPPGSPLELSARAEAGEVIVELADHGPGLPPGTEHRVFEKFFRIHAGSHHHGAGLGLAICKGIVEAHGGTIVAANRPGGGAVFRFTIPASQTPPLVDGSA
jgi:two-component system sensor histidine kinase KdpD